MTETVMVLHTLKKNGTTYSKGILRYLQKSVYKLIKLGLRQNNIKRDTFQDREQVQFYILVPSCEVQSKMSR